MKSLPNNCLCLNINGVSPLMLETTNILTAFWRQVFPIYPKFSLIMNSMYTWLYSSPILKENVRPPPLSRLESLMVDSTLVCMVVFTGGLVIYCIFECVSQMFSNSEESDQAEKQMKRALKRLSPISGYKSDQQETASWNEYCVICLEEFEPGDPCQRFPFCKHIFHSHCIRHWLKFQLTCPICRTIIWRTSNIKRYRRTPKRNLGHEGAHVDLHANGVITIV